MDNIYIFGYWMILESLSLTLHLKIMKQIHPPSSLTAKLCMRPSRSCVRIAIKLRMLIHKKADTSAASGSREISEPWIHHILCCFHLPTLTIFGRHANCHAEPRTSAVLNRLVDLFHSLLEKGLSQALRLPREYFTGIWMCVSDIHKYIWYYCPDAKTNSCTNSKPSSGGLEVPPRLLEGWTCRQQCRGPPFPASELCRFFDSSPKPRFKSSICSCASPPSHRVHLQPWMWTGSRGYLAYIHIWHCKAVLEEVDSAPFLDVSHPGFVHGLLEVALIGFLLANCWDVKNIKQSKVVSSMDRKSDYLIGDCTAKSRSSSLWIENDTKT